MTERQIAVVHDYLELHAMLRARIDEKGITREIVDEVSGLQPGYVAKLLAPKPLKSIGLASMGPVLQTLGIKFLVVEDDEALRKYAHRLTPRRRAKCRAKPSSKPLSKDPVEVFKADYFRMIGAAGGRQRAANLSKRRRRMIAKHAINTRWRKRVRKRRK